MRAAFEKTARQFFVGWTTTRMNYFHRLPNGDYADEEVQREYEFYQDSRLAQQEEDAQRWIRVDERCPEEGVRVLIKFKESAPDGCFFEARIGERRVGHWRPEGGNGNFDDRVSHWMPIPPLPQLVALAVTWLSAPWLRQSAPG